jgi:hypothetical protein
MSKLAPRSTSLKWPMGLVLVIFLSGCAFTRASVGVSDIPLLPEDMIYQAIPGQAINVLSDGKQIGITTTDRMVLTFQDVLVRQNERLNKQSLKKTLKGVAIGAIVPVLIIIGQILIRSRRKMKIEASVKGEA